MMPRDRFAARGLAAAVTSIPGVLRPRRVSPPRVEQFRQLSTTSRRRGAAGVTSLSADRERLVTRRRAARMASSSALTCSSRRG
jgi:hypothetical protein